MDALIKVQDLAWEVKEDADDPVVYAALERTIKRASAVVMDYLKIDTPEAWMSLPEDSPQGTGVPEVVQAAVVMVASEMWLNKEASKADPLSKTVKNLLHRLRDPAFW
jgi:hypothetical protein